MFVDYKPSKISINELVNNVVYLNNIFFEKKHEDNKDVVYSKLQNEFYDSLEKYRCSFYHKKYTAIVHAPSFEKLD
jgi:hypothetical protein